MKMTGRGEGHEAMMTVRVVVAFFLLFGQLGSKQGENKIKKLNVGV